MTTEEMTMNGGGTTGGGGSVVWPPGLTITSERVEVTIENCDATINWNTSYNSTSRVIYAPEGGNHIFDLSDTTDDPSKYGYDYTSDEYDNNPKVISHSVTVYSLTPNTTYYYRCISHASPPTISKELSFDTFNCLCEEEEEEEGAVEGTSTVAEGPSPVFPWYPAHRRNICRRIKTQHVSEHARCIEEYRLSSLVADFNTGLVSFV